MNAHTYDGPVALDDLEPAVDSPEAIAERAVLGMSMHEERPVARVEGNSIIVPGGARMPHALPPAVEYDGKVDPDLQRAVDEGAKRYHLDALAELAKDDERHMQVMLAEEHAHQKQARKPGLAVLALGASMAMLACGLERVAAPLSNRSGTAQKKLLEPALERAKEDLARLNRDVPFVRPVRTEDDPLTLAQQKRARKAAKRLAQRKG